MHTCEAALVTCIDFRLHQRPDGRNYVADYIKSLGVDCDLITRAGGVQDLLRPGVEGSAEAVIRDMDVSHRLHMAEMLIFLNHADCGAYEYFGFKSVDEELRRHSRDIRRTVRMLNLLFPKKWIIGSFAQLVRGTTDEFDIKQLLEIKPKNRIFTS